MILIAEDESKIAALMADYLNAAGFQTHIVAQGEVVLATVATLQPELVLLEPCCYGQLPCPSRLWQSSGLQWLRQSSGLQWLQQSSGVPQQWWRCQWHQWGAGMVLWPPLRLPCALQCASSLEVP